MGAVKKWLLLAVVLSVGGVVMFVAHHGVDVHVVAPAVAHRPHSDNIQRLGAEDGIVSGPPQWSGSECMPGTTLGAPTLPGKCKEGKVAPVFCQQLAAGKASDAVCGQFAKGGFSPRWDAAGLHARGTTFSSAGCGVTEVARVLLPNQHVSFSALDTDNPVLVSRACPKFRYADKQEMLAVLHAASVGRNGRGILFTGDSMMRQLFLRIIFWLRGQAEFSEHYFHSDGLYILTTDGDALVPLTKAAMQHYAQELQEFFPGYLGKEHGPPRGGSSAGKRVLLAMLFLWDPKPSAYRKEAAERMFHTPLHIASFMYWWQNKDPVTDIDRFFDALGSRWQQQDTRLLNRTTVVYVTTPWTAPKTFGGVENKNRLPRNVRAAEWVAAQASKAADAGRPSAALLLDYAGIAESNKFPKTPDGIHYMCIWTPKLPERANAQKYNGVNCRDPMNLAVAQWLTSTVAATLTALP